MSTGPQDYARYSTLGKGGLKMVLHTLSNPVGACVVWCKAGHCLVQENKPAVMDLLDCLACPTTDYVGDVHSGSGSVGTANNGAGSAPL